MKTLLPFVLAFLAYSAVNGQHLSGKVLNDAGEPVPFVNIFIKTLQIGTTTDVEGQYRLVVQPGEYEVLFSAVGYQSVATLIQLGEADRVLDVRLHTDQLELQEVVIRASKKNPAYEIIRKVIEGKDRYLRDAAPYRCQVYVKATEVVEEKPGKKTSAEETEVGVSLGGQAIDPFVGDGQEANRYNRINMTEMELTLNFHPPGLYKEERTAYRTYGDRSGLYLPGFGESDFNFYRNLVSLEGISNIPIISPLSRTAILSYKYKLEAAEEKDGLLVYKIRVIPRKSGNSTCSGYLYINDGIWNLNRLEIHLNKGGLLLHDAFTVSQSFYPLATGDWDLQVQQFRYVEKQGRAKAFNGRTVYHFSQRENNFRFPEKFFGNELARTTEDAFDRDSVYWKTIRPESLNREEQQMVRYRDSIKAVRTNPEYLDSIDAAYNKVKLDEILIHGLGFRDHRKKRDIYISALPGMIEFELVGGFRVALPWISYFKKWENEKYVFASGSASIGMANTDLQGQFNVNHRYDPFHEGFLFFHMGRSFYSINPGDAYLNQLKTSNYILNDRLDIRHRRELFNGFYLTTALGYSDRRSIDSYQSKTFINRAIDDDSEPLSFTNYQALISEVVVSYTPGQQYMSEPKRKIILGSNFPTFSLTHRKGWSRLFGSDINFDYVEAAISQDLVLGIFGQSKYQLSAGNFVNTRDLRYIDVKRFRQSDPYLYSDPRSSFQLLDTSLVASGPFIEFHHIHHFNGALINNLPLVKLLRLRAVAGMGALWVQEENYRHQEVFAGLERIIKIGRRRRLRVGVFGVLADSNQTGLATGWKISFDLIDTWKRDWSY